jgi:hypothetical protein
VIKKNYFLFTQYQHSNPWCSNNQRPIGTRNERIYLGAANPSNSNTDDQYQPHYLPGFSDCTSAITRSNLAFRSYMNPLAHTRGGLWASVHMYTQPRHFTHIKAHPKREPKCEDNRTIKGSHLHGGRCSRSIRWTAEAHTGED